MARRDPPNPYIDASASELVGVAHDIHRDLEDVRQRSPAERRALVERTKYLLLVLMRDLRVQSDLRAMPGQVEPRELVQRYVTEFRQRSASSMRADALSTLRLAADDVLGAKGQLWLNGAFETEGLQPHVAPSDEAGLARELGKLAEYLDTHGRLPKYDAYARRKR